MKADMHRLIAIIDELLEFVQQHRSQSLSNELLSKLETLDAAFLAECHIANIRPSDFLDGVNPPENGELFGNCRLPHLLLRPSGAHIDPIATGNPLQVWPWPTIEWQQAMKGLRALIDRKAGGWPIQSDDEIRRFVRENTLSPSEIDAWLARAMEEDCRESQFTFAQTRQLVRALGIPLDVVETIWIEAFDRDPLIKRTMLDILRRDALRAIDPSVPELPTVSAESTDGPPADLLMELSPQSRKILRFLWSNRETSTDALYRDLYGEAARTQDALRKAVERLNQELSEHAKGKIQAHFKPPDVFLKFLE